MGIETYILMIERIADYCITNAVEAQDYLEDRIIADDAEIKELICVRKELLTNVDHNLISGYLAIGYFNGLIKEERVVLFSILFEISDLIRKNSILCAFEKYSRTQSIFTEIPDLYNNIRVANERKPDSELINYNALEQLNDSEIVKFENKYAIIDSFLNPSIVSWSKSTFCESQLFIRLDPRFAFSSPPLQRLYEAVLIPANPNWWKQLKLHCREKTGASYILQDCEPTPQTIHQFWEYRVKGLRRLDIVASRNGDGNLSMMLEELSDRNRNTGFVLGKCIHLDTDAPFGTDFNTATLCHLDLAINVYFEQAMDARHKSQLADGKVEDASVRTHLLRIENIPMKALLAYTAMFFDSKILVNDWFMDQFSILSVVNT